MAISAWAVEQGDLDAAAARLRDGLRRLRRVNDTVDTSWCLDALAWIAYDEGRPERAAILLGAVERLAQVIGTPRPSLPELATHHERYEQRTRAALGEPAYQAAFARGEGCPWTRRSPTPWTSRGTARRPNRAAAATPLTRREQQVAELVAQGLSNKEIAAKLVISQRTAESHVDHILTKLGLTNRAQAAAWTTAQPPPGGQELRKPRQTS